jgi:hypothetical protein
MRTKSTGGLHLAVLLVASTTVLGNVTISEFMAVNRSTLQDEDGAYSDWIEIHNSGPGAESLDGWSLTDDDTWLTKWQFPATNLAAGARLVVFASGHNRTTLGAELHTSFQLDSDGEFLALVKPDGVTIATQFAPYPPQIADVSYGYGVGPDTFPATLVADDATARALIPTGAVASAWRGSGAFDDSGWLPVQLGVGFGIEGYGEPTVAYEITAGKAGNQAFGGALGADFIVVEAVVVTELGVFDDNSDGLSRTITAELWSRDDGGTVQDGSDDSGGAVLVSKVFAPGDPGTLQGGSRFKPLAEPLTLHPGAYTIVAHGYGAGERNGNGTGFNILNDGSGLLDFLRVRWGNTPGAFPVVIHENEPDRFGGGSFKFSDAASSQVRTDLEAAMRGTNASALLRIPFEFSDLDVLGGASLEMAYDDGFDAYVNGTRVASRNSPATPAWDSAATAATNATETIDLSAFIGAFRPGTNILAVQGMNVNAGDDDFLLAFELTALMNLATRLYFASPSPGAANGDGCYGLGVIINEVHYDPASDSAPAEFVELYNASSTNIDLSGWQLAGGIGYTFPPGTELTNGGYLVVTLDAGFFAADFPGVAALGPFTNRLGNGGDEVDLRDASGALVDTVDYGIGAPWPVTGDEPFNSIQLMHPGMDNDLAGSWRAWAPTPGEQNEGVAAEQPPQIRQVEHSPQVPTSGVPVRVSCKVTDPDGVGAVTLEYQLVEPGSYIRATDPEFATNWTNITMAPVGGGEYSVTLPGALQVHRRLVRYRVVAEDRGGASVRLPLPGDPSLNFAYFTHDGAPAWNGANEPGVTTSVTYSATLMNSLPIWHLISREDDVLDCQYNGAYNDKVYRFEGALVHDGEVYDHMHYRIRGSASTYRTGKNKWKLRFNRGRYFRRRDDYGKAYKEKVRTLNWSGLATPWVPANRGISGLDEAFAFRLWQLAGVPAHNTSFFHLRVVDAAMEQDPANQYDGDNWGLYLAIEQADRRFLDERDLPDGNVFNMHFGNSSILNEAFGQPTDRSDLFAFVGASSAGYNRSPVQPVSWWNSNVALNTYFSYRSVVEAVNHSDLRDQENMHLYHNPLMGKWTMIPWDCDLLYEEFDRWGPDGVQNASALEQFRKCLAHDELSIRFQNRARELQDLLLNDDQGYMLINEFTSLLADIDGDLGWPEVDRARWDHDPRSRSVEGPSQGSASFFENPFNYTRFPGKVRTLDSADFDGSVKWVQDFVVSPGFGGAQLEVLADNALIPQTPVIAYVGATSFPANALLFRSSPFTAGPGGAGFAAMEWRVGEIRNPFTTNYLAGKCWRYEVETVWSSGELTAFESEIDYPLLKQGRTYRARVRHKDTTGRFSHWSSPAEFAVGEASNALALRDQLRISEVMYNSAAGSDFDFVEFHNVGDSLALDLAGVAIMEGVSYTFPTGIVLAAGGYVVVAKLPGPSFDAHYGTTNVTVLGPYSQDLGNGGEGIAVEPPGGGDPVVKVQYRDGRGWPLAADGTGHSLVPSGRELAVMDHPGQWRASTFMRGSPGELDPGPVSTVCLNEIAAHTDTGQPAPYDSDDWIELYNPLTVPVDIGGWWLSDDGGDLRRYQLTTGTVIAAHGYLLLTETQGLHTNRVDGSGFGLDKAGEQVFLSYLPSNGTARVVDAVRFKGQENGTTLGRYPDGAAYWRSLAPTPDASNTEPAQHVVISKIMYHPAPTAANPEDNTNDEYVEILNPTPVSVALWTSAGSWRLDGGVAYLFPSNTVLEVGARRTIVSFDPVTNAVARDAFLDAHALTNAEVTLLGPYSGRLDNRGERITLEKPQPPDLPEVVPSWVVVDEVIYSPGSPWPGGTDGTGVPLCRFDFAGPGTDPASWSAGVLGMLDVDRDGLPDEWEVQRLGGTNATAEGHGDSDGMSNADEYVAGTDPLNAESVFKLEIRRSDGFPVVSFEAIDTAGIGYSGFERYYDLRRSSNLTGVAWTALPGLTNVRGRNQSVTYTNASGRRSHYRGAVRLQLSPGP